MNKDGGWRGEQMRGGGKREGGVETVKCCRHLNSKMKDR